MGVKEFLINKTNDPDENIFCKPTKYKESFEIIQEHFLGENWYSDNPISRDQITTEQLADILTNNESYKFKQYPWYKQIYLKIYCKITGVPIYYYY